MRTTRKYRILWQTLTGLLLIFMSTTARAGNKYVRIINLEGKWNFSIGYDEKWLSPGFNDADWDRISSPSPWEDQGFHGYDGYATYRKEFIVSGKYSGTNLYLYLGYIDDVDATYINGHKIGITGTLPPDYQTAYWAKRLYVIPEEYLNFDGKNVITIVVFDSYQRGGIVSGELGIYTRPDEVPTTLKLHGAWKFQTGDDFAWKARKYDDSDWAEIFVPGKWEDEGFRDYDGFAWYRRSFYYKGSLNDEKIVLVIGKIDDVDAVYINGVKAGGTGELTNTEYQKVDPKAYYNSFRTYVMDASLLEKNQWNTIAVRVYDSGGVGGIYEGPVGFLTQKDFINYWKELRGNK
ncbi:MAG: hypothetical protein JW801_01655 [Bacteroidales bacterium]|nr:hypothetical protein [Bacteroidales bacterium]